MKGLADISYQELEIIVTKLSELGVTSEHFQRLRLNGKYAQVVAGAFLGNDYTEANYDSVRDILGENFVSPGEVAEARKCTYSDELRQQFAKTLPSEEFLLWLRDHCCVLMPGPPVPMSLLEIRDLDSSLFYSGPNSWYAHSNQKFSCDERVSVQWLVLGRDISQNEQEKFPPGTKFAHTTADICWGITSYKKVCNTWLFSHIHLKTSSRDAAGHCVSIGLLKTGGISVMNY